MYSRYTTKGSEYIPDVKDSNVCLPTTILPIFFTQSKTNLSYVRVHPGTKIPVGTMANRELRALRNEAHRNFDQLHKQGLMSKEDAYCWLASILAAPLGQAHIGYLGEYYCKQVIEESKKVLDLQKNKRQGMPALFGDFQ